MIVAGSVLALLLMGLAVDGFINPGDDEADDLTADAEGEEDLSDQSGASGDALSELLFPDEDTAEYDTSADENGAEQLAYSPLDVVEPQGEEDDTANAEASEGRADADWATAEDSAAVEGFLDVETVTELADGEEVAYVEVFDTETDTLVLEFDGTPDEAPIIDIDHTQEDDAAVVLSNGVPVTLIEGAGDMTADHVRVIMSGDEAGLDPQILLSGASEGEPENEPLPDLGDDAPAESAPAEVNARDAGFDGPSILPGPGELVPDTEEDVPGTGEVIPGDVVENVIDPVVDVVETISDGLPEADAINTILDDVIDNMIDVGGTGEMLDARTGIDDVFGTGGDDAQTGTFNNDMVTGGDGQDALFGDEGNDTLQAGAGNDELYGDLGNDNLQGGDGVDFLSGGEGHDTLYGGAGRDLLFGGEGDDLLHGGAADDFLQGGLGADTLSGGSGNDVLDGVFSHGDVDQDGADVLRGGDGDDTLIIGQGDTAQGGDGADTFISGDYIETADIAGHVEDFHPGEDRIEVIFDAVANPNPVIEVQDFADGSGADIILNGEVILSVSGAQGLDPSLIDLRGVA
ncbi:MAG: hypothetical protein JKY00_07385 [Roseicyclus sp.]|nr:hypothetical protein [Roseicyclus sp.]